MKIQWPFVSHSRYDAMTRLADRYHRAVKTIANQGVEAMRQPDAGTWARRVANEALIFQAADAFRIVSEDELFARLKETYRPGGKP